MTLEHMPAKSGIYAIVNGVTGDRYVGQAKNIRARVQGHFRDLSRGKHKTNEEMVLQKAWDESGGEVFEFVVLELVDDNLPDVDYHVRADNLSLAEHFYINEKGEYNVDSRIVRDEFAGLVTRKAWREPTPEYARPAGTKQGVSAAPAVKRKKRAKTIAAPVPRPEVERQAGVFAIVNTLNGDRYVGASVDAAKAAARTLRELRSDRCPIVALREAWERDGRDAFEALVLECVRDNRSDPDYQYPDNLSLARQYYINEGSEYNRDKAWVARKYSHMVDNMSWRRPPPDQT